jgi:hypothetical protein
VVADTGKVGLSFSPEGVHLDAVLGLSMTPTTVGLVLVEGQDADGATMDRDAFAVRPNGRSGVAETCEQAAAAVLRSEAMAADRGHRLHSIGVTWSEDADAEASMLLKSLSASGFDNVVAVRLPEATEALARGIADAIGYDTTAVCVIEPESVITLIVHLRDGTVETSVQQGIDDDESLKRWLSSVFARAAWEPEALVVVGSVDLDDVMAGLEDALGVPVFAPAEAEVALARGAALASAQVDDYSAGGLVEHLEDSERDVGEPRRRGTSPVGPLALLVGGTLTFVVSVSLAIGLHLTADSAAVPPQGVSAADTADAPAATQQVPPAFPPPVAIPAPLPVAPPPEVATSDESAPAAETPADLPATDEVPQSPVGDVPPIADAPAPTGPDGAVAPAPPPADLGAPPKKPGLLSRIRDRIGGGDEIPAPPVEFPPPPPEVPPPPP